jgi:hypothetical protein
MTNINRINPIPLLSLLFRKATQELARFLWGQHPIARTGLSPYRRGMKAKQKKQALTFGNLIETVYGVRGNRRARGIIRLAIDAHVIVFRKQQRAFDFSGRKDLV